jgi:streptogramin lyase
MTAGGITAGPDGNIWFTEYGNNTLGRITPTGVLTEFPIPKAGSYPTDITSGPDGNLWFTEDYNIGRITPTGTVTAFPIPTVYVDPRAIVAGPRKLST